MLTDEPDGTPPIFAAASGKPTKAQSAYHKSKSIPLAEEPPEEVLAANKEPIAVRLDKNSIDRLAEKITKGRKKDTADGFQEGLLKTDALSQPAREKAIRNMQEDMLTQLGHSPVGIATMHNRDAGRKKIRTESLRIGNNQRKKRQEE
jgi:hypothetical protein